MDASTNLNPVGVLVILAIIGWIALVLGRWISRALDWYLARRQSRKEYAALIRTHKALERKDATRTPRSLHRSGMRP